MPVPFADLQLQYQTIRSEIDGAIASVIRDNAFIRGSYVDAFESLRYRSMASQTRGSQQRSRSGNNDTDEQSALAGRRLGLCVSRLYGVD